MPLNNSRMDILAQRMLTDDHGERVSLYPVLMCSCRGETPDGHASPVCAVCKGTGRAYHAAIPVKGIVSSLTGQNKALVSSGLVLPADLVFTPDVRPNLEIHDYDVIRFAYGMAYEGDVLVRGVQDRLLYVPSKIKQVERHDPLYGMTVSYTEGVDFTVSGRDITWVSGHGPQYEHAYSVMYLALFDWIVYPGITVQRVKRGTSLGQAVVLRKRHLADFEVVIPETLYASFLQSDTGTLLESS